MKKVLTKLKILFGISWLCQIIMLAILEYTEYFPETRVLDASDFLLSTCLILITLAVIPFSLWMMRMKSIRRMIDKQQQTAYNKLSTLRIAILFFLQTACIISYYIFCNPSYFYLWVILIITSIFICPTRVRMENEMRLTINWEKDEIEKKEDKEPNE